jgi:hypothetical protein
MNHLGVRPGTRQVVEATPFHWRRFRVHSLLVLRIVATFTGGVPMSSFLETQKPIQTQFKHSSKFFSEPARQDGVYKKTPRPFCVPVEHAEENLIPEARKTAVEWFRTHKIKWHDGQDGTPSNHLCDSQVCCVNFLFPFADKPESLALLLRPFFPDIKRMLPVESGKFVTFEWIGERNYLGEKVRPGSKRTRGANFTSADAIVAFERADGKKQVVLIEWKYTESYGWNSLTMASSGTDRTAIYRPLFDKADCPIDKSLLPSFESLFFEPFYQLMRQQFLANGMEREREFGADIVSLLHIAPDHNRDFRKVTSPELKPLGDTATGVWAKLVKTPGRFQSASTEGLFGGMLRHPPAEMKPWAEYLTKRYPWATAIPM